VWLPRKLQKLQPDNYGTRMDDLSIILDWAQNIDEVASHVKFSSRSVQLSGNRVKFADLSQSLG